jgi:hypothetical protein
MVKFGLTILNMAPELGQMVKRMWLLNPPPLNWGVNYIISDLSRLLAALHLYLTRDYNDQDNLSEAIKLTLNFTRDLLLN